MPTESTTRSYSSRKFSIALTEILDDQIPRPRDFLDLRHAGPDIPHPKLLRPVVILLEALAEGAQVHEEDVALQPFAEMLLGNDGFFRGIHAADGRAVIVLGIARTNALQEGNPLRLLPVEGPQNVAGIWAGSGENPLELQRGQHIREAAITQVLL